MFRCLPHSCPMKNFFVSKTDFKYTLRLLGKKPGFTLLSILVLGGGLGISIFTFTFCYYMSYRPLPQEGGEDIVRLCASEVGSACTGFKAFEFANLRRDIQSLEHVSILDGGVIYLETDDLVRRLDAVSVEPGLFTLSGGVALLGRTLQPIDMEPGAERVAVIGYELWLSLFDGGVDAIDRVVSIDNEPTKIVGVMPEGYKFPHFANIWLPAPTTLLDPVTNKLEVVSAYARIKPGESKGSATAELDALMERIRTQYPPDADLEYSSVTEQRIDQADSAQVMSLPMSMMGGIEGLIFLAVLNLLATLVFLLVCINVGTLLLARVNERMRDISVRVALGAPRKRLLMQVMGESVVISVLGGIVGVFVAGIGMEVFRLFMNSVELGAMPFWWDYQLGGSTLIALLIFLSITLLLVSAIPSWRAINGDFNSVMRDGTRGSLGLRTGRISRSLVVIAIALITFLLYTGVLVGGSLLRINQVVSNVDGKSMLSFNLDLPGNEYDSDARKQFYRAMQTELSNAVSIEDALVYLQRGQESVSSLDDEVTSYQATVTETYGSLSTFDAALLEGRALNEFDLVNGSAVAVISQSLAEKLWPGQNPLQQQLLVQGHDPDQLPSIRSVVGVVSNEPISGLFSRQFSLSPSTDAVYLPFPDGDEASTWVLAKHNGQKQAASSAIHRVIKQLDSEIELFVIDWEDQQSGMFLLVDYGLGVTLSIGLFSFLVAIAGIYGLTKNFMDLHRYEIGTMRALGATDKRVRFTYLRKGSRQLVTGFLIGNGIALPILYLVLTVTGDGLVDADLLISLAVAVIGLFATVLLAIYQPLQQILKLEPSAAIRYQ